ncbi:MAG: hypothetical protein H0A76_02165 [Candidatus Thiodubiliella endoseptemdiera]|uniref:Uncharacterized protein n=1 Tax=Candidatus Thiodubiliella endoseptemdiera TaxID=2738886 RepID=A0A853EZ42_9GAMM|nr:hypothetical protein [Candidatus Thiodubiliella endoseptemdiera]
MKNRFDNFFAKKGFPLLFFKKKIIVKVPKQLFGGKKTLEIDNQKTSSVTVPSASIVSLGLPAVPVSK